MSYALQRIENLARRLGVPFREAARLCGRKGSRVRRERQCACAAPTPTEAEQQKKILAVRWDLRESA